MDLNFNKLSKNIYKYINEYHKSPKKIIINDTKIEMLRPILTQTINEEVTNFIMKNIKVMKKNIKMKKNDDYENYKIKCIRNLKKSVKYTTTNDLSYNAGRYTINNQEKLVFSQTIFKHYDIYDLINNFNKINDIFIKNNLCPKFNYTLLCNFNKDLLYLIHVYDKTNNLS